ncbi:hypothetical protein J3U11_10050 [Gilliamella sp. B2840]|nr:hypothetical protein [Gilliamella sp. B2840]
MSLGSYPKTDLKKARYLRSFAQNKLSNNIDPRLEKNEAYVNSITPEEHLSVSFIEFAENWLICKLRKLNAKPSKKKKNNGRGSTELQILRAFKGDIFCLKR